MRSRSLAPIACLLAAMAGATPLVADTLVYPDQTVPDSGAVSPITAAFVAAVGPFNAYLEAADRLAEARGEGRTRRAIAGRAADDRAAIVADLEAWAAGIRRARTDEAHAPTIDRLGPIFSLADGPIDLVIVPADLRQRSDYIALQRLEGRAFDEVFAVSELSTLRQLENTYVDYIKNGDDQVLRALSVRDLGRVRARIASLR